ncbi:MAG: phosphoesterase, partial [Planctomycetes bacterium]|nr:phosphoesterase [Planctomycetota bacterium]
ELLDEAGEATVGRPHMARVLMRKGYVANFQEAFDKWLGEGKPCYFGYDSFGPKEAIELVLDAGGVPVIAHPFWLNRKNIEDLDDYIGQLKGFGLKGMEIIYSDHPPELQQEYRKIAEKHGMIVTGGSDFHGGTTKPEVTLGHGPGGGFHIPGDLLGPLKALAGVA